MLQHLIVILIFAVCLYLVVRRTQRIVRQARKGKARCATCTETSCPLRDAARAQECRSAREGKGKQ